YGRSIDEAARILDGNRVGATMVNPDGFIGTLASMSTTEREKLITLLKNAGFSNKDIKTFNALIASAVQKGPLSADSLLSGAGEFKETLFSMINLLEGDAYERAFLGELRTNGYDFGIYIRDGKIIIKGADGLPVSKPAANYINYEETGFVARQISELRKGAEGDTRKAYIDATDRFVSAAVDEIPEREKGSFRDITLDRGVRIRVAVILSAVLAAILLTWGIAIFAAPVMFAAVGGLMSGLFHLFGFAFTFNLPVLASSNLFIGLVARFIIPLVLTFATYFTFSTIVPYFSLWLSRVKVYAPIRSLFSKLGLWREGQEHDVIPELLRASEEDPSMFPPDQMSSWNLLTPRFNTRGFQPYLLGFVNMSLEWQKLVYEHRKEMRLVSRQTWSRQTKGVLSFIFISPIRVAYIWMPFMEVFLLLRMVKRAWADVGKPAVTRKGDLFPFELDPEIAADYQIGETSIEKVRRDGVMQLKDIGNLRAPNVDRRKMERLLGNFRKKAVVWYFMPKLDTEEKLAFAEDRARFGYVYLQVGDRLMNVSFEGAASDQLLSMDLRLDKYL
ncbi:MAG TPA: hypothetical protein VJC03_06365, partial [bacterium]|nr:hypothetical protein [bacterium]